MPRASGGTRPPSPSDEHDDQRWLTPAEAHELVIWPAYHRAIEQVEWLVANPEKAAVYRLPDPT